MRTRNHRTFLISTAILVLVVGTFFYFNDQRKHFTLPVGIFRVEEPAGAKEKINDFLESQFNNFTCFHYFYGYDNEYLYVDRVCGRYSNENSKADMLEGHVVPTRLKYFGTEFEILKFDQPQDGSLFMPSFRSIFPVEVYDAYRARISNDQEKRNGKIDFHLFLERQAYKDKKSK